MTAGVKTVIASLWEVDDLATRALFEAFYLQTATMPAPASSMQQACRLLADIPEWQHPYFWAGFQVNGLSLSTLPTSPLTDDARQSLSSIWTDDFVQQIRAYPRTELSQRGETMNEKTLIDNADVMLRQMQTNSAKILEALEKHPLTGDFKNKSVPLTEASIAKALHEIVAHNPTLKAQFEESVTLLHAVKQDKPLPKHDRFVSEADDSASTEKSPSMEHAPQTENKVYDDIESELERFLANDSTTPNVADLNTNRFLRYFDPSNATDSRIVQLSLATTDVEISTAWETLRHQLEDDSSGINLADFLNQADYIWGYTVMYMARRDYQLNFRLESDRTMIHLARMPHASPPDPKSHPEPLACSSMHGVDLYLMTIPNRRSGINAGMVYVACVPPDKREAFVLNMVYGERAVLVMADLIFHKSFSQIRQYRGHVEAYKTKASSLRENLVKLLEASNADLSHVEKTYINLVMATSIFDDVRFSLEEQLENYRWWHKKLPTGDLANYHQTHIQTAHNELNLLIGKGESTLDMAKTTLQILQTRQNEAQRKRDEKREQHELLIGVLIGIFGVALAISQIIDSVAARAIINIFSSSLTSDDANHLFELVVQFGITIAVMVLIGFIYWKWNRGK